MTPFALLLSTNSENAFKVELHSENQRIRTLDQESEFTDKYCSIYSDQNYKFFLEGKDVASVKNVHFYVNDTYVKTEYSEGRIEIKDSSTNSSKVFLDCYGFVELGVTIIMNSGMVYQLYSNHLPVLVKKGNLNEAIKSMVKYVLSHQDSLLFNGIPKARDLGDLIKDGQKTLFTRLILLEEISRIYESNFGFFKANSRFSLQKVSKVENFEHLQFITQEALQYIASHPEQLKPTSLNHGIQIGHRIYQPEKVVTPQNIKTYDTYENRIVLSFLRRIIDETVKLKEKCKQILQKLPQNEDADEGYVNSSFFMFLETRKSVKHALERLDFLNNKFAVLWGMYRSIFSIRYELLNNRPRPTAIFLAVPQYNKIFLEIYKWFDYGVYSFKRENFILSILKISTMYESYLLAKMIAYLTDKGYVLKNAKKFNYNVHDTRFNNTNCLNTFHFCKNEKDIILYYQPIIYDYDSTKVNGIGLYRNNTLSINSGWENENYTGGRYYNPDYLLKVEYKGIAKYLIIDAKFSDENVVYQYHVRNAAFKYIFSISETTKKHELTGLCIMYGKCKDSDDLKNVYNKQLPNNEIIPFAKTIPFIEDINAVSHYNKFDILFEKILDNINY